jgi:hypothetical protein
MDLKRQHVWDYVGDNYVHRLIQNKGDGKLVELRGEGVSTYEIVSTSSFSFRYFISNFRTIIMKVPQKLITLKKRLIPWNLK